MKRSFVLAVAALAVAALAAFAEMARIRIVNAGGAALELDDGSVLVPGSSTMEYVPAGYPGTICGAPYPALAPGELYLLRVAPERVAKAKPAPVAPAVEPAAEPEPAPAAIPAPSRPASQAETRPPEPAPVAVTEPASAVKPVARPVDETGTPGPAPQTPAIAPPAMPQVPDGMVLVPAGENTGVDPEYGPYSLISPGFFMDRSEITLAQWHEVREWAEEHGYRFDHEGNGKGDNHPVHTISWYDCAKWCNARSEMNGLKPVYYFMNHVLRDDVVNGLDSPDVDVYGRHDGYRLPSRDQWDFAARGGVQSTLFPWGNAITRENANVLGHKGTAEWFDKVSRGDPASDPLFEYDTRFRAGGMPFTCPAGTFPPNGYGLTEMQGNLNEWLNDTSFWITAREGAAYGGSWAHGAGDCRLGILFGKERHWANDTIGFRTVLPAAAELPFSLRNGGNVPEAVHPDAEERRANAISPEQINEYGWQRRNPSDLTFNYVREERRKWRMASGAIPAPAGATGQSIVNQDVVPTKPPRPQADTRPPEVPKVDARANVGLVPAETVKSGGSENVAADSGPGFRVRRVHPDAADLLVFFKDGGATITPNANFSYGSISLGLENRTKWHIAVCVIRVIRPSGANSDMVFTDIPPGAAKEADSPETIVGEFAGSDFKGEPFLFPALMLAVGPDGNMMDLYETADCLSVGYLNIN